MGAWALPPEARAGTVHRGYHTPMRLPPGLLPLLVLALSPACSDDGLVNQSSGQAETTTTGGPTNDDVLSGPSSPSSTGLDEGTTARPPEGTTAASGDTSEGSTTVGIEGATTTDTEASSTTDGTATVGTTGAPDQPCVDGCAVEFACGTEWMSEADCVAWCEANLVKADAFSPFCRAAWEAVSACVATLTCEEFAEWSNPVMFPYPCSDADVVLSVECKGQ
jgi:hypothetical protein